VSDLALGALAYWATGWALAFGVDQANPNSGGGFVGNGEFFLVEGYNFAAWIFQLSFAATAATIDSGAVAERMNFKPYLLYSFIMTAIIQPICVHWCWDSRGWLFKEGFHDFAGSGPVHLVGGVSALVAAAFIGPRIGRFPKKGVIGKLTVKVVQGEKVPTKGDSHPYALVRQLTHGSRELRSNVALNGRFPRWGSTLTFDVYDDKREEQGDAEAAVGDALYKGRIRCRCIDVTDVPDYYGLWPRVILDEDDYEDVSQHFPSFEMRHMTIKKDRIELFDFPEDDPQRCASSTSAAADTSPPLDLPNLTIRLKDLAIVVRWQKEHAGFTMVLKDRRYLEVQATSVNAREAWIAQVCAPACVLRPSNVPLPSVRAPWREGALAVSHRHRAREPTFISVGLSDGMPPT
jgi:hypothetical protein